MFQLLVITRERFEAVLRAADEIYDHNSPNFHLYRHVNQFSDRLSLKIKRRLSDPQRLWDFYESKKEIILNSFAKKSPRSRNYFRAWLSTANRGLIAFIQHQGLYNSLMRAEGRLFHAEARVDWIMEVRNIEWFEGEPDKSIKAERVVLQKVELAEKNLRAVSPDLFVTRFAGDCFEEGGGQLVRTYIRIACDLYRSL